MAHQVQFYCELDSTPSEVRTSLLQDVGPLDIVVTDVVEQPTWSACEVRTSGSAATVTVEVHGQDMALAAALGQVRDELDDAVGRRSNGLVILTLSGEGFDQKLTSALARAIASRYSGVAHDEISGFDVEF